MRNVTSGGKSANNHWKQHDMPGTGKQQVISSISQGNKSDQADLWIIFYPYIPYIYSNPKEWLNNTALLNSITLELLGRAQLVAPIKFGLEFVPVATQTVDHMAGPVKILLASFQWPVGWRR
jgi:hypothetical protein